MLHIIHFDKNKKTVFVLRTKPRPSSPPHSPKEKTRKPFPNPLSNIRGAFGQYFRQQQIHPQTPKTTEDVLFGGAPETRNEHIFCHFFGSKLSWDTPGIQNGAKTSPKRLRDTP